MAEKSSPGLHFNDSQCKKGNRHSNELVFRSPQIDLLCKSTEIQEYERKCQIQNVWVFPNRQEYRAALQL